MKWTACLLLSLVLVEMLASQVEGMKHSKMKMKKSKAAKNRRMTRCRKMMIPLENELSKVQREMERLSNPIHVHLHGVSQGEAGPGWSLGNIGHRYHRHGDSSSEDGDSNDFEEKRRQAMREEGQARSEEKNMGGGSRENPRESSRRDSGEGSGEEEKNDWGKSGSHVHIHLNMAAQGQGEGHSHDHRQDEGVQCPPPLGDSAFFQEEYVYARCDMRPDSAARTPHRVGGTVFLRQKINEHVEVKISVYGFSTAHQAGERTAGGSLHGFHVHEFGDLGKGCKSFGGHYNPEGHAHGAPGSGHRHAGDWGNIVTNHRGEAVASFNQSAFLYGPLSIIGRGIVIHEGEDDHGQGGTHSSRTTGSAGSRIACCVIARYSGAEW